MSNDKIWERYTCAMDDLQLSSSARERVARRLEQDMSAKGDAVVKLNAERRSHLPRWAAAAAVTCTLVIGGGVAYATGTLQSAVVALEDLFGSEGEQAHLLETYASQPLTSTTEDGITVTAEAAIGDEHGFTIVFSVSADAGQIDLSSVAGRNGRLLMDFATKSVQVANVDGRGPRSWFYDADPDDGSVQFVYQRADVFTEGGSDATDKTAHVTLGGLGYEARQERGSRKMAEYVSVSDATWELDVSLDYATTTLHLAAGQTVTPSATTIPGGQTFDPQGKGGTLTTLDVSSVGIYLVIELGDAAGEALETAFLNMPVSITLADGTTVDATYLSGAIEDGRATLYLGLDEVVDADNIETVSVASTTIGAR